VARRATAIKQLRKQNPHTLVLDAGNALTGQDIANQSRGQAVVEAMNLMGYDALALGALELELSAAELRAAIDQAQFEVLSANTVVPDTGKLFTDPYAVVKVGGRRVGLLGLTTPRTRNPDLLVKDPLAAAQEYVPQLAKETDLIVVLSNAGLKVNQQIAAQVPGIDVIVGAGGKTVLEQPQVIDLAKARTLLVQAGYEGRWLGVLRLELDGDHTITDYVGELWPLNRTVADDPEMVALINRYKASLNVVPTPAWTVAPPPPATRLVSPTPTVAPESYPSPSPGP